MKLDPISIFLCLTLIMTVVKAQRMFKLNKPVIDLNARPQVTTTPKMPEERRKLSIFPRNMAKFVVTTKPYSKVRTYSPWEISTKRPLMQKMLPSEAKTSKIVPVTRPSLAKFTHQLAEQIPNEVVGIERLEGNNLNKKDDYRATPKPYLVFANANENRPRGRKLKNQFVSKDIEPQAESTNEVSTKFPEIIEKAESSTESRETSEVSNLSLENARPKRLSIQSFGVDNNIDLPSKTDMLLAEEQKDKSEFIFMKDEIRPVYNHNEQPSNSLGIEEDMEIATEVIWLEEVTSTKFRPKRRVNIIEEENLGTTVSGFKFTGRERQVNSHIAFKNINA